MRRYMSLTMALVSLLTAPAWAGHIHDGKSSVSAEDLRACVVEALGSVPGLSPSPGRVALVMETAAAESRLGKYDIRHRDKGSHGTWQIRVLTAEDTMRWFKVMHPDIFEGLAGLYDDSMNMRQNLEYSVEFGAAMCAAVYRRMAPKADISTREKRAKVWKAYYNTSLGTGTAEAYLSRCRECLGGER